MNVIVSNKQKDIIDNANIDAIKDLNGLFNVDDLINKFKNYFFSKMILDATSVVNFASKQVLTTLAEEIGSEKLIILLPSNPEPPTEFKKLLIELKIYNFTNNIDDVIKFIDNPNTYEDAIKLVDNSYDTNMYVDSSIKEEENNVVEEHHEEISNNVAPQEEKHSSLGEMLSSFNVHNVVTENKETNTNIESIVDSIESSGIEENNSNKNTFLITDNFEDTHYEAKDNKKMVIGIKDVTLHAGSTSLIYMMHKILTNTLKKNVLSIEIGKNDFRLFREKNMISVDSNNVKEVIDNSEEDVVLVDLNDYTDDSIVDDVLYLIEPSTIMLNRLMADNKNIFNELKNKKVLLNKSLLSPNDLKTLSSEAGIEFFYSIESLNDRTVNNSIIGLIELLGIK